MKIVYEDKTYNGLVVCDILGEELSDLPLIQGRGKNRTEAKQDLLRNLADYLEKQKRVLTKVIQFAVKSEDR